jgi:release factor glutamine methyltransferase
MINKEKGQRETRAVYEKVKAHKKPYSINIEGIQIDILPNVFSPAYFNDSIWFAKIIQKIVGKESLLEIGTGTGIIALFAGLNGAKVTATDINPDAIKNANLNFKKHNLKIKTYYGDLFDPLPSGIKFDFIFWNHPFNRGDNPNEEILLRAGFDYRYKSLEKYFAQAHRYLNPGGKPLLGTGNLARLSEIKKISTKYEYKMTLIKKKKLPMATNSPLDTISNDFRIYGFKRRSKKIN